ncbi:MAG: beta-glucosidase [Chitinophagaceae bacterium]|nr:MAG: beta-glucosidase [Chitinophagaceae bacterium]
MGNINFYLKYWLLLFFCFGISKALAQKQSELYSYTQNSADTMVLHSPVVRQPFCNCDSFDFDSADRKTAVTAGNTTNMDNADSISGHPRYLDSALSIEERIKDLLPRMTLEEKISQLCDDWGSKGIPRLKIPALLKTEGLHGQSYSTGATIFPQAIAMGSTFDTALIYEVGKITAIEAKAAGIRASWSPVLDISRDPRRGRVEETYGEDPYLVSRMGVAWIKGFQGENMIAIPKHFPGQGEPLGGRDSQVIGLSDRVMRTVNLVPFRDAVEEAHAGGMMASYSTFHGVPDNGSVTLLQKILRQEWGFRGIVVSDCGAIQNFMTKQSVVNNLEEACRMAIRAGVDINCGSGYKDALLSAVKDSMLRESDLNPEVAEVLRAKFKLGLFEHPGTGKMVWEKLPAYDIPSHRALAKKVAEEGSVLLKNDHHLLPLSKNIGTVAVIGPDADMAQTGDYSGKPAVHQLVTVLQGIQSHVSSHTKVLYAKGCEVDTQDTSGIAEAVGIAKQADVVVLVVGDNSRQDGGKITSGENYDGATLQIPGVQPRLIKAVQAVGKPIVMVLVNGKPFILTWEAKHIPAILETWYPGEEGGDATADLLFGDANPSGKLPITFPRSVGQVPLYYDYEPSGRRYDYYDMPSTPLYRFGYGLSYTSFRYSHLRIVTEKNNPGYVTVSADVQNTGDRAGDDVVQLYLTDVVSSVITPVLELKGISRISLKAGEKKAVTFKLTPYQLSLLDANMKRVVEPGIFKIHVGGVSPAPPPGTDNHKQLIGFQDHTLGVTGTFQEPEQYQAKFHYELIVPDKARADKPIPVTVIAKNVGNLLDVAKFKLYDQAGFIGDYRFEISPGQIKKHAFMVTLPHQGSQMFILIAGKQLISHSISVY